MAMTHKYTTYYTPPYTLLYIEIVLNYIISEEFKFRVYDIYIYILIDIGLYLYTGGAERRSIIRWAKTENCNS